jgi:hypothetical protein
MDRCRPSGRCCGVRPPRLGLFDRNKESRTMRKVVMGMMQLMSATAYSNGAVGLYCRPRGD